jgi:hypothetical protein
MPCLSHICNTDDNKYKHSVVVAYKLFRGSVGHCHSIKSIHPGPAYCGIFYFNDIKPYEADCNTY